MLRDSMTAGCLSALLGLGALAIGCGGDAAEAAPPSGDAGGSGGADAGTGGDTGAEEAAAGAAGASGTGGAAGGGEDAAPAPDRGDPADFPADCLATCEEACARLTTCGGADSTAFPLDETDCLQRCQTAGTGPGGSQTTGANNFKCCASQEECEQVKECGGWLANRATVDACGRYCECRLAASVIELTAGRNAPEGYRFAPDVLMIDPGPAFSGSALPAGVQLARDGKLKLVRLDSASTGDAIVGLQQLGRVLPTFVDAAGRISAASGDLVVVTDNDASLKTALSIAEQYGLGSPRALRARLAQRPTATLRVLEGADAWRTLDALTALSAIEGVHVELDQWRGYVMHHTPDDPQFGDQWHLQNTGQNGSTASVDGRVNEAWDITMGDSQVVIAINDDGVDLNHPEFAGKIEPGMGFPPDWETQMAQGAFAGHGTSVAGVAAAAADNALGGAGVCPSCRILPHLLGETTSQGFQITDADVAQGFTDIVDAGAWVVNNSWGLDLGDPIYADTPGSLPPLASVVKASFDYAESNGRGGLGTVILFAAGNSNTGLDPYTSYDTILAVSAVDDLGLKPYYSSFGADIDVAAPSNGGFNGITTTAAGSQYTAEFGGTSSACPFVTGVVGLVLSANPTMTAQAARDAVTTTATRIDPVFGQWDQDGHSVFHGAGLVNAYAAVKLAAGGCATPETCVAPSDECGANCATGAQCDTCRTHADCASGYVCQALPSMGALMCVAEKGAADCLTGTHEVNGYCLPLPATCGLCGAAEECNGRDDDCNGVVDDANVCQGGALCFIDGPGCGTGLVCAGRRCETSCTTDTECGTGGSCELLTNQYGAQTGDKACAQSQGGWPSGSCTERCESRASGLADDGMEAFMSCVEDNTLDCDAVIDCRDLLTPPPATP